MRALTIELVHCVRVAGEGMVYRSTEKNLMPFYQRVAKETHLRVIVYNGDADPSINSFMGALLGWVS